MIGKTMLGLFLAIGLSTIPAFADTETILSPHQQFQNGIPLEQIQCRDSKILMETPRNTPACVNENSVETLLDKKFILVSMIKPIQNTDRLDVHDFESVKLADDNSLENYVYSSIGNSDGNHGSEKLPATLHSVEIPSSISVNQTVSIQYTLSWYHPDGTSVSDDLDSWDLDNLFTRIFIFVPEEITVLNEDKKFDFKQADLYAPHSGTRYYIEVPYSVNGTSGSIDLRLDDPLYHDRDKFYFHSSDVHLFQLQRTDDGLIFVPFDNLTNSYDLQQHMFIEQFFVEDDPIDRYDMGYTSDVDHVPEFKTAKQTAPEPQQEHIYLEKFLWSGYADFLRNVIENGGNFADYLITPTFTQKFIDDFTNEYPEFRLQNYAKSSTGASDVPAPLVQLNMASPVPFVDDGREIQRSMLQKAPAPVPMYDKIMGKTTADDFAVSSDGVARFAAISHEKYSLNEGVGYYPEDWMPTYIPDGQKLLYTSTTYYEKTSNYVLGITFVPTSFVLHANTTNYDLQVSKGFTIGVEYWSSGADETEDNIELLKETRESQPGNYGGFTEMTRDGKTVMAYEGGNLLNHYSAGFSFNPDKFTSMHVTSNYHTLDELLPIFESIMK